jgi:tRNA pseudouridine32 synthase/23S rRNA pseudouridine746 synthase
MLPALVYADTDLLVFNKPAGMLSVPGRGADKQYCLASVVHEQFADALVVHRLDQATSGMLMFARGRAVQSTLSRMFAKREIEKRYLALVEGKLEEDDTAHWQQIDLPLAADWLNRPRQRVDREHGKPALTRYRVLGYDAATHTTRVELAPVTGRSHQLRVHMQAIGHPICGDALYGGPAAANSSRLMLHACSLEFTHPVTQSQVCLRCEASF